MKKVVIIGGVAGGMSAATRLRRLDENLEIIVLEKGPFVSFANCGLPYHVSGEIEDKSKLQLQTPEKLKARFNIDVRPYNEVTKINSKNKTVTTNFKGKEVIETYDKLVISTGAKAFIPAIKNIEKAKNVFTLRNIPDLDNIMEYIEANKPKKVAILGAGFIGLEMLENLHNLLLKSEYSKENTKITLIEKAPQVMPPLDEEMAAYVQNELEKQGVVVVTSQSAVAFEDEGKNIVLENGEIIESDLTILSVGVQPENTLAKDLGIKLGVKGGILVDNNYETSEKDIYAVGDAIVVKQQITGNDTLISLASPANRQGRQVADVIAGVNRENRGSIGTGIVRIFGLSIATTGLNERIAKNSELDVSVVHITGKDHASYYPNATDIVLKLVFNKTTGEIYGAQGIGNKGVDKRIDILATAIKGGLTIFDLPELELSYAPPFGSAKDPVNMIGYVAINIAEGFSESIQWYELEDELKKGKILLDVRNEVELKRGAFKNAINIPLDELRDRLNELDKSKKYIIACHSGQRSYIGERILKQYGYDVKNLDGAYSLYNTIKPNNC